MAAEELKLCPVCKIGHMRFTGRKGDLSEANKPESSHSMEYVCDNDDCKHKEFSQSFHESH